MKIMMTEARVGKRNWLYCKSALVSGVGIADLDLLTIFQGFNIEAFSQDRFCPRFP